MITFKKTFDYYATDNELGDYITLMADVVIGEVIRISHDHLKGKTLHIPITKTVPRTKTI